MKQILYLLWITILGFNSCKNTADVVKSGKAVNSPMIKTLDSLVRSIQPMSFAFDNKANAEYMLEYIKTNPNNPNMEAVLVRELLYSGQTELAIQILENIINKVKLDDDTENFLFKLLAISYIRLGEQKNCQDNHGPESCIVPITGSGIHQNRTGSSKGMQLLLQILKKHPEDLVSVWLLNIAAMTLDSFPEAVPSKFRIDPEHFKDRTNFPKFENISMYNGTGVNQTSGGSAVEDFDGDGLLDIVTSGYSIRESLRYLHNDGNGQFSDWTEKSGLKGLMGGLNIIQADYDNDGRMDLLVLRGAWVKNYRFPLSLLRNREDGVFEDVTRKTGLYKLRSTQAAVFSDFNNDGFLDLFIGNEAVNGDLPLELFKNDGKGHFQDVTEGSGLEKMALFVKGVSCGDVNNDGLTDLYLSVMGGNNLLFLNASFPTKIRFQTIRDERIALPKESFPTWMFDFNNDGQLDIFCGTFAFSRANKYTEDIVLYARGQKFMTEISRLYLNQGNLQFLDVSESSGLNQPLFVMGSNKGDLDNDGFEDMYLGTGEPSLESLIPNKMFRNVNGEKWEEISYSGGFAHLQKGHAISFADFDHDGDLDIFAEMGGAFTGDCFFSSFFENPGFSRKFLSIRLRGDKTNFYGAHARLTAYVSNETRSWKIHRQMDTGASFGTSPYLVHFGLSDAQKIDSLVVYWPASGKKSSISGLDLNGTYLIHENNSQASQISPKSFAWDKSKMVHTH
ncbi:MAG: CRTAC1 family protein [Saprospiraceae bacterium]|nr:CRTAC1 family protein [Saprospiraceae bacterium]